MAIHTWFLEALDSLVVVVAVNQSRLSSVTLYGNLVVYPSLALASLVVVVSVTQSVCLSVCLSVGPSIAEGSEHATYGNWPHSFKEGSYCGV